MTEFHPAVYLSDTDATRLRGGAAPTDDDLTYQEHDGMMLARFVRDHVSAWTGHAHVVHTYSPSVSVGSSMSMESCATTPQFRASPEPVLGCIYDFDATTDFVDVDFERQRGALIRLLHKFETEGFSWWVGRTSPIDADSIKAAIAFVRCLPNTVELPRVSPDGEGGILFVWATGPDKLVVVIDGWKLHAVEKATTANAKYHDDLVFAGDELPEALLRALPVRARR